jgi:P4 family phage/plasmid primase-like protien
LQDFRNYEDGVVKERLYMNDTTFKPSKQEKVLNLNSKSLFPYNNTNNKILKLDLDELGDLFLLKNNILVDGDDNIFEYKYPKWESVKRSHLINLAADVDHRKHTNTKRRSETLNNALTKRKFKIIEWNLKLTLYEIPCKNGMLDFTTGTLREHKDIDFINYTIPWNYIPQAQCKRWLKCLDDWFDDDENKKLLLQEFMGYILSSGCNLKKALWLVGANDTGKSKIINVIAKLIGEKSYSTVSMAFLDDPRKVSPIKDKKANLIFDEKTGCQIAAGGFKTLVSGESMDIDVKYQVNDKYTPSLKLVAAMNELPTMTDNTNAIITRILLLKFNNTIKEIDENLMDKLMLDMEGILVWSIAGLKRRMETGKWTEVAESVEILSKYKIEQSPVLYFIENSGKVEKDEKSFITCSEFIGLFQSENKNATPRGIGNLMSKSGFPSSHNGKERIYKGLRRVYKTKPDNPNY